MIFGSMLMPFPHGPRDALNERDGRDPDRAARRRVSPTGAGGHESA